MSEEHEITIIVHSNGELETSVGGISGPSCHQLSAWLSQLGVTIKHEPHQDVAYRPRPSQVTKIRTGE